MPAHRKVTDDQLSEMVALRAAGLSLTEIGRRYGLDRTNVGRHLKRTDVAARIQAAEARRDLVQAADRARQAEVAVSPAEPVEPEPVERVRIGDPHPEGGEHTVDSAMGLVPKPVDLSPDATEEERAFADAARASVREAAEETAATVERHRERKRPRGRFPHEGLQAMLQVAFMTPLEAQAIAEGRGSFMGATIGPPAELLDRNDRLVTVYADGRKRVMRVPSWDLQGYLADGWVAV